MTHSSRRVRLFLPALLLLLTVVSLASVSIATASIVDYSINNYPLQQIDPALSSSLTLSGTFAYDTSAGTVVAQGTTFTMTDAVERRRGPSPLPLLRVSRSKVFSKRQGPSTSPATI